MAWKILLSLAFDALLVLTLVWEHHRNTELREDVSRLNTILIVSGKLDNLDSESLAWLLHHAGHD